MSKGTHQHTFHITRGNVRRLKDKGRQFREAFLAKLALLLRGTVAAPTDRFGETLADEHIRGGVYSPFFTCVSVLLLCLAVI